MKNEVFEEILREGSHNPKRILKALPMDKDFPISQPTGKANKNGEDKPAVKPGRGAPKVKREFAQNTGNNQPRCARQYDTYEAKYSKTGSLVESFFDKKGTRLQERSMGVITAIKFLYKAEEMLESYEDEFIDEYMTVRRVIDDLNDKAEEWK